MEGYKKDKTFEDIFWTLPKKLKTITQDRTHCAGRDDAVWWIKCNCDSVTVNASNQSALFSEMIVWCDDTFGDNYAWNFNTIYFKHPRDKMLFNLRWSVDLTED